MNMWLHNLNKKTGTALLTVLIALLIISLLLFEFQHFTMVERQLAYNDLNQLQCYYYAKAGVRMGLVRLAIYGRALSDPNLKKVPNVPIDQYLNMIWNIDLPNFPPSETSLDKLLKVDKDAALNVLKKTHIKDGFVEHKILSESSKINLNYLILKPTRGSERFDLRSSDKPTLAHHVGLLLVRLIENTIRESEKPYEEFGNIDPYEVVYDIMDWINPGNERITGGDKDAFYLQLSPPYHAKKHKFYSVEELRLVKSMNSALFRKIKSHVTVYGSQGQVNLNYASPQILKAIYPDFTDDDLKLIEQKKWFYQGQWPSVDTFVNYVDKDLGRFGFKQMYANPKDYPFTVGGESFLIKAKGVIPRSDSQIEKSIQVAVALTAQSKGGKLVQGINSKEECEKDKDRFWYRDVLQCYTRPRSKEECRDFPHSFEEKPDGQQCCLINNVGELCWGGKSKQTTTTAESKAQTSPDAMKILYWVES